MRLRDLVRMRVSEVERLSDDALFLGEKAVYQDLF